MVACSVATCDLEFKFSVCVRLHKVKFSSSMCACQYAIATESVQFLLNTEGSKMLSVCLIFIAGN